MNRTIPNGAAVRDQMENIFFKIVWGVGLISSCGARWTSAKQ